MNDQQIIDAVYKKLTGAKFWPGQRVQVTNAENRPYELTLDRIEKTIIDGEKTSVAYFRETFYWSHLHPECSSCNICSVRPLAD